MMRRLMTVAAALALLALAASFCLAGEEDAKFENLVIAASIVEAFPELSLTTEQVQALKDDGWGYGEITIAASLAVESGESLQDILALFEAGQGWGEIAKSLGLPAGGFGRIISGIAAGDKGRKAGKSSDPALEEACCGELARKNHGLTAQEQTRLRAAYRITHREMLAACTMARANGDTAALETALRMRSEHRGWQDIMDQLEVDIKGVLAHGQDGKNKGNAGEAAGGPGQGTGRGR